MSQIYPAHGPATSGDHGDINFGRVQRIALLVGVVGIILTVVGAFLNTTQFYQSYLWAYMFWFGLGMGSFGLMMLQYLVGGRWGASIRRVLESGALTLPLMGLLFIPIIIGMPDLYSWSRPEVVSVDPLIQHKQPYLNTPFWIGRAVLYFAIWSILLFVLNRWSNRQDRTGDPKLERRFRLLCSGGLVLYMLTMTFAAFDWVMSLEPHWYSTIFGVMVMMGQGVSTFAFVIVVLARLSTRAPISRIATPNLFNDLGNFLLAFVMLFTYMSFSQFILIWSANLPEEVTWYLHRMEGGWIIIPILLVLFHFAFPFFMLLMKGIKRRPALLARLAAFVVVMQMINVFWLVIPSFHQDSFYVHWMDFVTPIGIGGIWVAAFAWLLQRKPLLPLHDSRLQEEAGHH